MPEDKKEAEETHAYTPGLKIKKSWLVKKDRILPIPGKVLVNKGDTIKEDVIVAETLVPGDPEVVSYNEAGDHAGCITGVNGKAGR